LELQRLEERTLPSILFGDNPGLTVSDNGGPVLANAQVRLIFWGNGWNSGGGPGLRAQVQSAVDALNSSTYFYSPLPGADLSQYRPGGQSRPTRVASFSTTYNSPGLTFTNDDVFHMLQHEFGMTPQYYYYVIPDPNSALAGGGTDYHTYWSQGSSREYYGYSRNLATPSPDDLTDLYARVMAGSITDPDGTALQVNPRNPTNWNEIGDGEAGRYSYRVNGVLAQSYWSRADGKFTVPTGQTQNFYVSYAGVLTVNGDQLANHNDTITLDVVNGGVRVTLNGEVAQFEPGAIRGIEVRSGNGTDTINVLRTPAGIPVNINSAGPATVNVGANGSLDGVQGLEMTVSNSTASTGVVIDDHSRAGARAATFDTLFSGGVQYTSVTGLTPGTIYVQRTDNRDLDVYTGTGAVDVNVLATCGHGLNLHGNSPGANNFTVNVGNNGSLQNIQGNEITVTNPGGRARITVDDHNDTVGRAPVLSTDLADTTYGQITGLALGPIYYRYADTSTLTVWTGTTTALVNVQATGTSTNVAGNDAQGTTINVGNAGSAQQIQGALSLSNPAGPLMVNVNDQNDPAGQPGITLDTVTQGGEHFIILQNLAPAAIFSVANQTSAFVVNGGSGSNTWFINASAAGANTTVNGGSGSNTLHGPNSDTTWQITGSNAGSFTGGVSFTAMQNLIGGAGADTFVFADGAGVSGNIDGGGGTNMLDYTAYSTGVDVNLQTGTATGVAGGITDIQNVTGGQGDNILVGNGNNNVLTVYGGHNLVIAGGGAGTLNGGTGLDILIGGTTNYDTDDASLQAFLQFWEGVTPDNYNDAVNNLLAGNGVPLLDATTVTGNGGGSTINGNGALALIYTDGQDTIGGFDPNSQTVAITP
jgi:hypothetical protein